MKSPTRYNTSLFPFRSHAFANWPLSFYLSREISITSLPTAVCLPVFPYKSQWLLIHQSLFVYRLQVALSYKSAVFSFFSAITCGVGWPDRRCPRETVKGFYWITAISIVLFTFYLHYGLAFQPITDLSWNRSGGFLRCALETHSLQKVDNHHCALFTL